MDREEVEKMIRENWFKDHVATLTDHGDIQVLEWRKPNSIHYAVKYVFDWNHVYISGDIGEAVYNLTWRARIHSFDDVNLSYFTGKLAAYHEDRWDFDDKKAVARLREWLKDLKENEIDYDQDEMKELFEETRGCSEKWEWVEIIHKHEDFISDLDPDYWEWFYNIGDEYPMRLQGYLIGLKMASEQLKSRIS